MDPRATFPFLFLIIPLSLSDNNFVAIKSSDNSDLCPASCPETSEIFLSRSQIDCVRKCQERLPLCYGVSHVAASRKCEMFFSPPFNFAKQTGCRYFSSGLQVDNQTNTTVGNSYPSTCSFPFTYNGGLFYSCIQNMANVCSPFGCLRPNRTAGACDAIGFVATNSTQNVSNSAWPDGLVPVRSVFGWLVILSRDVYSVFNWSLPWTSYRNGFGTMDANFWVGLETIYQLTNSADYTMRVEFVAPASGGWYSAEYWTFRINGELDNYRLSVGGYTGDAGNAMNGDTEPNAELNGMQFTTIDRDRDAYSGNCAVDLKGGWWYRWCCTACLTRNPISWHIHGNTRYPTYARMMIKSRCI